MAGLKEQAIWESEIYQIEENDPVHGGEDGITNKPAKQLANRTAYLRQLLTAAGQKIVPKTITATSTNIADETGHTHAIAHGTTGQKGIVQLTNDTGLDSEALALTAKAGKKLAMELASLKIVVNGKYNEQAASTTVRGTVQLADSLTDTSVSKALTARQGKALNDKIKVMKAPTISGSQEINLDFADRNQIIENLSPVYRGTGRYYATFYNSAAQHRFQNLPLGNTRGEFELTVSVYGSFSFIEIYYLSLKRRFFTQVNWNNPTLTLNWHESVNQNMAGAVYLHNYDEAYAGGVIVVDEQVDMNRDIPRRKMLSTYEARAGRYTKSVYRTHLLTNKNAEIELSGKDANDAWKRFLTMMTATGNVIVGHNADNGRDRVQINGTVKATAPEANANNDQIPTTAWVNSALDKLVNSDGYVKRGGNKHNIELSWQPDGLNLKVDVTNLGALVLSSSMVGQVAFFASSTPPNSLPPSGWLKANGAAVSRTTYAALFARIGTRFGAGDGSTTFNLPDLRGEFIRGWDDGRNIDAGRALGSHQGDAIRNITGEIWSGIEEGQGDGAGALRVKSFGRRGGSGSHADHGFTFDASRVVPTAHENRPRNIALLACIKY